jgi:hypothetical protein
VVGGKGSPGGEPMKEEEIEKWNEYINHFMKYQDDKYREHMRTVIFKILETRINPKNEWCDGFNTGLEWSIRIYLKDKSAY